MNEEERQRKFEETRREFWSYSAEADRKKASQKAKTAWIWFIGATFLAIAASSLLLGVVAFGLFIRALILTTAY